MNFLTTVPADERTKGPSSHPCGSSGGSGVPPQLTMVTTPSARSTMLVVSGKQLGEWTFSNSWVYFFDADVWGVFVCFLVLAVMSPTVGSPPARPSASASKAQPSLPSPRDPTQPQAQTQTGTTIERGNTAAGGGAGGGAPGLPVRSNTGPIPVASSMVVTGESGPPRLSLTAVISICAKYGECNLNKSPENYAPSSPSVWFHGHHHGHQQQQQGQPPSTREGVALLDNVKALDKLPRLGDLTTLDLREYELRVSLLTINFILFCFVLCVLCGFHIFCCCCSHLWCGYALLELGRGRINMKVDASTF
jgi:hypothetical protein